MVAVAHGSRDPAALRTVTRLLAAVRAARPRLRVELGHVEIDEPALPHTLAGLPRGSEVVLVPLLFGRGHHVKHDLPRALADAPHLSGTVAGPLGPHPLLAEALHDRLAEAAATLGPGLGPGAGPAVETSAGSPAGVGAGAGAGAGGITGAGAVAVTGAARRPGRPYALAPDAVVLAAAGSRDPESADGTRHIAAGLRERLGGTTPVLPGYASAARPTVAEAVRTLRADGHRRIALASCFTAPGYFAARCAAEAPWAVSAPLGAHPALVRLVLHRFDEALAATSREGASCALTSPTGASFPVTSRTGAQRTAAQRTAAQRTAA
nr:CbiX/SirB N-terminal domain-containing protein [Streptomyces sp. HNM0575]